MVSADERNNLTFWMNEPDPLPARPLQGDCQVDVAIIGGGFLGLSTALHLIEAQPSLNIVLLEAGVVGSGASGRCTGIVRPGVGQSICDLQRRFGPDNARRMHELSEESVNLTRQIVQRLRLSCDWEEVAHIKAAFTTWQARSLDREQTLLDRAGFGGQPLNEKEMREVSPTNRYAAGLRYRNCAQLNPTKLCRELKRVLVNSGISVYEMTAVHSLTPQEHDTARIETDQGTVNAREIVIAANAWLPKLGLLRGRIIPLQSHVCVTAPLSESQRSRLGWSMRESISDKRNVFSYYRLTNDDRIVFGGGKPVYGMQSGDRVSGATDIASARVWQQQRREFASLFPSLPEVQIMHEWSGTMGMTRDQIPVIGRPEGMPNVVVAGGWSGHGVSLAMASGGLVADLVLRRETPPTIPWLRNKAPRLPNDPIRACGLWTVLSALCFVDHCGLFLDACLKSWSRSAKNRLWGRM